MLAGLGIMWGALLIPKPRDDARYERTLKLLADVRDGANRPGRWVMIPRRGSRFMGPRERSRSRVRQRRRRVLGVLGEAIAFSALIGAFPPLRAMWVITGALVVLLAVYVALLVRLREAAALVEPAVRQAAVLPEADLVVVRRTVDDPVDATAAAG